LTSPLKQNGNLLETPDIGGVDISKNPLSNLLKPDLLGVQAQSLSGDEPGDKLATLAQTKVNDGAPSYDIPTFWPSQKHEDAFAALTQAQTTLDFEKTSRSLDKARRVEAAQAAYDQALSNYQSLGGAMPY
jgi:hypothetical protein